jgi:hypothetical protein
MTLRTLLDSITQADHALVHGLSQEFRFDAQRGPYDLTQAGKSTLLVTIGDSWTYGTRLAEEFGNSDSARKTHCYGQILANLLDADWANLAIPATNNLWMARHYADICNMADQTHYDQIMVFVTLTEFGREICTDFDLDPGLNDRYRQARSGRDLAVALAEHTADVFLSCSHPRVKLGLGINYVNNIYPDRLRSRFVDRTWLECCLDRPVETECLVVGTWALDKFKLLPQEFNSDIDQVEFMQECIDWIDRSQQRLDLIYNTGYNHKQGYGHPNSKGHEIWAKYIQKCGIFG